MKVRLSLHFFWIMLFLSGCTVTSAPNPPAFGVIYTNSALPDSAFVVFDKNGEIYKNYKIPAMGIFQIIHDTRGNLFFPVQYENKIYSLTNDELEVKKSRPYPIYMTKRRDFHVITFNSALQSGTVEWQEGSKTKAITVAGFPRIAAFDQTHIYVFATIIEQKKPVLYVLNRHSAKIAAVLPLRIDQANDMQIVDHRLYITSVADQKQIAILELSTNKITYLSLPESRPEYFITTPTYFLFSYQNSTKLTKIDRKSHRILEQIELPQPVLKWRQKNNELYVLSQIPANGQGLVGVYEMSNWKLKRKYLLPSIRDTTVQDIIVF